MRVSGGVGAVRVYGVQGVRKLNLLSSVHDESLSNIVSFYSCYTKLMVRSHRTS